MSVKVAGFGPHVVVSGWIQVKENLSGLVCGFVCLVGGILDEFFSGLARVWVVAVASCSVSFFDVVVVVGFFCCLASGFLD